LAGAAQDNSNCNDGVASAIGNITISIRPGSCFCSECRSGNHSECGFAEYAGSFKDAQLVKAVKEAGNATVEEMQPREPLHTFIRAGRDLREPASLEFNCNVVVRKDDTCQYGDAPEQYSFYLMRVVRGPYILTKDTEDDFDHVFAAGSEVVGCRLFTLGLNAGSMLDQSLGIYEYNKEAGLAIVDVASITMVGFLMHRSGTDRFFQLSAQDNDRALLSVESADPNVSVDPEDLDSEVEV
jgi:hypothetical protein